MAVNHLIFYFPSPPHVESEDYPFTVWDSVTLSFEKIPTINGSAYYFIQLII
jgi:hypothetical protein